MENIQEIEILHH